MHWPLGFPSAVRPGLSAHVERTPGKRARFPATGSRRRVLLPQTDFQDPDWDSVRDNPRYQQAIAKAKEMAADDAATATAWRSPTLIKHADRSKRRCRRQCWTIPPVSNRRTVTTSIRKPLPFLVPDAANRPIYPVFSQQQPVTEFARYLPQETATFSISGGVDPRELYQFIEDTFRGGGPLGEELIDQMGTSPEEVWLEHQAGRVWTDRGGHNQRDPG